MQYNHNFKASKTDPGSCDICHFYHAPKPATHLQPWHASLTPDERYALHCALIGACRTANKLDDYLTTIRRPMPGLSAVWHETFGLCTDLYA